MKAKKPKRKSNQLDDDNEKPSKKAKLDKKDKKKTKKDKKTEKESKRTKLVHFEKKVTILNPDGDEKPKGKKKELVSLAPAKHGIIKKSGQTLENKPRQKKKEQKPNSTSRMSLHDDKQTEFDNDVEIEQST